jgi:hypothetical protein
MNEDWKRSSVLAALRSETPQERLARLRALGFLDDNNEFTAKATDWGDRVSHTETEWDNQEDA